MNGPVAHPSAATAAGPLTIGRLAHDAEGRALQWVAGCLRRFDPLGHSHLQRVKLAIKAASELALVCSLACTSDRKSPYLRDYRDFAAFLWEKVFCDEALQDYLLTNVAGLPSFSLYVSLSQCGYEDADYRAELIRLLDQGYITAIENTPSVQLDFLYNLETSGLLDRSVSAETLYRQSFLSKKPALYPLTTDDAYAITHTIFFITSFGRCRPSYLNRDDFAYFEAALPRLLQFFLRRGNLDVSAELLHALRSLELHSIPLYETGWLLLLGGQNDNGSFPGPATDEISGYGEDAVADTRSDEETKSQGKPEGASGADWIDFRDNYHTTLAFLLALERARPFGESPSP